MMLGLIEAANYTRFYALLRINFDYFLNDRIKKVFIYLKFCFPIFHL